MTNFERNLKKKLEQFASEPGRIFGLVYPYMLTIGIIIGLIYVSNISQTTRVSIPAGVPDTTHEADLKVVEARTVPPVDIMSASKPSDQLVASGKNLYTTVCASCHGEGGRGDGPGATGLNPAARDFTKPDGWKNGPKISQIYKTLEEGFPGTAMVPYDYLLPEEKIGLAHYIRQTFIPNAPVDTQDELVLLDQTYQLSKGKEISAQITVASALNIIAKENADNVQKIINALGRISADANEEGAKIFNNITTNKARALGLLSRTEKWKGDQQQFIKTIAGSINENGFNGNVYRLNSDEWNTLQSYISRYF